jgi:isopenicillin N synthase-like dioxygenase
MPAPSDRGSITILFQDDCGGLEVENQHAPGRFIKVIPLKNAIVMNIEDLLLRWSNGELIQLAAFLLMLNRWQII